jgi:hypothetical protein
MAALPQQYSTHTWFAHDRNLLKLTVQMPMQFWVLLLDFMLAASRRTGNSQYGIACAVPRKATFRWVLQPNKPGFFNPTHKFFCLVAVKSSSNPGTSSILYSRVHCRQAI